MTSFKAALFATVSALLAAAGSAQAADPIRIGLTSSFTGSAALFGQHDRYGVEMAIAEINAAGGVLGRPLALDAEDNKCNPSEGVKAATKLVTEHKVVAVIGAMCSSVTLAIMPIIQRNETPLVIPVSTSPAITPLSGKGGNVWAFRTTPSDDGMAIAIGRYLKANGVARAAIVAEDTDYGRGGARGMTAALKANGIALTATEFIPQNTPDFTTLLTKIDAMRVDRVAVYMLSSDVQNFFRQYESFGTKTRVTGRAEMSVVRNAVTPEFLAKGGLDGTSGLNPYAANLDTPENRDFVARFRARYNTDPIQMSFYSYEATRIVADAITRAGKVDRHAIRDALQKTRYKSIMGGDIEFDDYNQAHNNTVMIELRDGGKVTIVGLFKS